MARRGEAARWGTGPMASQSPAGLLRIHFPAVRTWLEHGKHVHTHSAKSDSGSEREELTDGLRDQSAEGRIHCAESSYSHASFVLW